ncbi:MAG: hypothetical protein QME16_00250, partial [Planctomycetota bacterium]|nr:hypothetical protein [Planctomycetota bacterium]
ISIKDYFCRVRKKNKTKGRPSKEEMVLSAVTSYNLDKMKPLFRKMHKDIMLYGTGIMKVKCP